MYRKKIINTPENVVIEMCKGIAKAHPEVEFIENLRLLRKRNRPEQGYADIRRRK